MRSRVVDHMGRHRLCEGGNEYTAALYLQHLSRIGLVTRFKFQPFNLADYGNEKGYPDLLVELASEKLIVVEVKSSKYITAEYLEKYRQREALMKEMGLTVVLWSDKKTNHSIPALSASAKNNLADLDRCSSLALDRAKLEALRSATQPGGVRLASLLDATGATWDEVMWAWAWNHLYARIEDRTHEATVILPPSPINAFQHLFSPGPGTSGWWRSLPDLNLNC